MLLKTLSNITISLLSALLLSSCAGLAQKPATQPPVKERQTLAVPAPKKEKDELSQAYADFTMAIMALSDRQYERARGYLANAIERDPGSVYLNHTMALVLKKLKRYQEAILFALKCVQLDEKEIGHRILLADLYTLAGEDDLSLKEYEEILKARPQNQRARLILSTILIRKQRFKEALPQLDILISQNPDLVIAYYYRGRIYLELKEYDKAEEAYKDALDRNESLEPALFDLGTLYQMSDRPLKAVEIYKKLISFYPDNLITRERLVNLYLKLGRKKDAEKQTQEIKDNSKPGEPGRQALGLIYLREGKLDESIEELELIVKAWPNDYKSRYYLASAYEKKGDTDKALEHFALIVPDSTYYTNARMHMAYLLETQEKYDAAVKILQNIITKDPEKTEAYLLLASIYETQEKYDKAISIAKKGLTRDPKNIDLLFRLGVLYDKKGDKPSCIQEMKEILKIDSNNAEALNYIAYTYAEAGINLDEAMAMLQKALKIKPENGYIVDSLGWVYYQKGLFDKALEYLNKAANLTPDDPTINEHLGDVYVKMKMYAEGLERYKKALALHHPHEEEIKEKIRLLKKTMEQLK
jgi:tetratricopeptide (TPR) repeat protein